MQEIIKLITSNLGAEGMHLNLRMEQRKYKFWDAEYEILGGLLKLVEQAEEKRRLS